MKKNTQKNFFSALSGFFLLVRVQNIILLTLAFYFTAKYIFLPEINWNKLIFDKNFFLLVLSTNFAVASGYLINSFYDFKKDLINRPQKTLLEQNLKQKKRLYLYFLFNFIATFLAFFISWRAALFIAFYIFLIWFYSHKLKGWALTGNIIAAVLYIFPFFGIFLFFKKLNGFILLHAFFLFNLLLIKDLVKSLVNIKGELLEQNMTLPVKYGEKRTFQIIFIFSILLLLPIIALFQYKNLGNMKFYFYLFVLSFYSMLFVAVKKQKIRTTYYFYVLIKILLVLGVFSLMLINI